VKLRDVKSAVRSTVAGAFITGLLAGCGDGGDIVGPDSLSTFARSVVEEIAVDQVMDLLWVVDGTHGGTFPRLAFAFSLPGVHAGILGSATVVPTEEAGLFEPSCDTSVQEDVQYCLRLRLHEGGDYDFQVYYTLSPDPAPRLQPDLTYAGEAPAATVRYEPQPLRIWEFDLTPEREVVAVSVQIDEQFTVTPGTGASVSLTVAGVMEGIFDEQQELSVDLALAGLPACAELRILFHGIQHGAAGGEIRCGSRLWADLVFAPGEPLHVAWRE
jgi:hypothetical protein